MTQVALQTGPTSGEWGSSATPTLDTPAGSDGERQVLIVTWSSGASVSAPSISGWTLDDEEHVASSQNRTALYSRTISGSVAAGTVSPTFSGSVSGCYWAGSFNGIPVALALTQDASWPSSRTIPATSAAENESLHLVAVTSANYPRTVPAVSGYTEVYDDYRYHGGGGVWIGVNRKDVSAGSVASSAWTLYDEAGSAPAGDQTVYASIIFGPIPSASGTADITVDAEFPIPTEVSISRTTGGTLAVSGTDTVTVELRDHNGDPIRNVVPSVGAAAGGVYTLAAFSATDANGQTSATLTGAAIGSSPLSVYVGTVYSNELTVTVVGDGASAITAVDVTPASATIGATGTQQFTAVVTGTGTFDDAVTWSVESGDGSIDSAGLYTAGSAAGSATIRATSVQDPTEYDEATVTVVSGSVTVTWRQAGVALASTAIDYWIINSDDELIASGSTTTSGVGAMTVAVPGQYVGQSVLVVMNNLDSGMTTAGKIHSQTVAVVA